MVTKVLIVFFDCRNRLKLIMFEMLRTIKIRYHKPYLNKSYISEPAPAPKSVLLVCAIDKNNYSKFFGVKIEVRPTPRL